MTFSEALQPAIEISNSEINWPKFDLSRLNISQKSRASRLPWKGQFSPELIEYFLDVFSDKDSVVLDPFSGSGTVMFECQERGLHSIGVDANPAAFLLSRTSSFAKYSKAERNQFMAEASSVLNRLPDFSLPKGNCAASASAFETILSARISEESRILVDLALMLGLADKKIVTQASIKKGLILTSAFLSDLALSSARTEVHLGDARFLPNSCCDVDLIVTSPPYINVFNYHQNYRPVLEFLDWQPLKAASTEIGANRKHRQNRLLTVVQYCLDMYLAVEEMGRVLNPHGKLILVVGRSSTVLGNTFYNSKLLSDLLLTSGMFDVIAQEPRAFKNRFGAEIIEDVIVAQRVGLKLPGGLARARMIGVSALENALLDSSARTPSLIQEAIDSASRIAPSLPLANQVR